MLGSAASVRPSHAGLSNMGLNKSGLTSLLGSNAVVGVRSESVSGPDQMDVLPEAREEQTPTAEPLPINAAEGRVASIDISGKDSKEKKEVLLVAKRVPADMFGDEPQYTRPSYRPIPVSLLTGQSNAGPKRDKKGGIIPHTILGDVDDFLELEAKQKDSEEHHGADGLDKEEERREEEDRVLREQQREVERRLEEAREKRRLERKRWLDRLHIFQRYRELREENALKNWKRHSVAWAKVERDISRNTSKTPQEMLMTRLGEYREKMEERDLIVEALKVMESRRIDFWSPGLRIGNDLLGLMVTMPEGGPRELERVVTSEGRQACGSFDLSTKSNAHQLERKNELRSAVSRIDPFYKKSIDKPQTGEFMEVVGKPLMPDEMEKLTEAFLNRLEERAKRIQSHATPAPLPAPTAEVEPVAAAAEAPAPTPAPPTEAARSTSRADSVATRTSSKAASKIEKSRKSTGRTVPRASKTLKPVIAPPAAAASVYTDADWALEEYMGFKLDGSEDAGAGGEEEEDEGIELLFAATHMTFHVLLNEVSTSILTVYNRGRQAVYFQWRKAGRANSLKIQSASDGVQRFYFCHKKGVILPGTAFDFRIIFKAASPGGAKKIFSEMWTLYTSPQETNKAETTVTLQGFALEQDFTYRRRRNIEDLLARRQATTVAKEIVELIVNSVQPAGPLTEVQRKKLLAKQDQTMFVKKNADLCLTYDPKQFDILEQIWKETETLLQRPESIWDRSLATLYETITQVPDLEERSDLLHRLNDAVSECKKSSDGTAFSMLYVIAYDIFVDVADRISESSERIRKRLGLPLKRSAATFFEGEETKDEADELNAQNDPGRKPTPLAAAAAEEKTKKTPPAAGGKDTKGAKAAAAKNGKGKKGGDNGAGASTYSRDRRLGEIQYRRNLSDAVAEVMRSSIYRMCDLFDDVAASRDLAAAEHADIFGELHPTTQASAKEMIGVTATTAHMGELVEDAVKGVTAELQSKIQGHAPARRRVATGADKETAPTGRAGSAGKGRNASPKK
ncbi:hypothetical protein HK101_010402 [Irineochytrium annulatum]|nr:hypothetical protein HK101_010402 [Irineochytrium annulatum]